MSTILQFLTIGAICFFYNKPISNELARIYLLPVRWIVGEREWLNTTHRYLTLCMRIALYGGVLMCLAVIVLEMGSIYHLF